MIISIIVMNYYKISDRTSVAIIVEAEDIAEAVIRLLTITLERNTFPFNELHIVPITKVEYISLRSKMDEENYG